MLSRIIIKNLGLISFSEISFQKGFTAITGETGAGKSFFCNALEIGLGERIKKMPTTKTIVEVECFGHSFRRIIDEKKSRFFIDDIPEPLDSAESIIANRFYFHRQNDTAFLSSSTAPSVLIDEAMGEKHLKESFTKAFEEWKYHKKQLEILKEEQKKNDDLRGFWEFSLEQMKDVVFSQEDIDFAESIVEEENENAEKTKYFQIAIQSLGDENVGAISQLQKAEEALQKASYQDFEIVSSSIMPLANLLRTLEKTKPVCTIDLENSKIFLEKLRKWCKSYNVVSPQDLLLKKQKLEFQLEEMKRLEEKIKIQEIETQKAFQNAKEHAFVLSEKRKSFIPQFEQTITSACQNLGMDPARFVIQLKESDLHSQGVENIDFLFSANKNQPLAKLSDVASGGEKSRIMLALYQFTPLDSVIIFDEIDTGVSGAIAEKMAMLMKDLSKKRQIIAITHLPQIASKADHHIVVSKTHLENFSQTELKEVVGEERETSIALMLSGESLSEASVELARKMLINS